MSDGISVVFPRSLLKQFILLYKEHPCLWDRENIDFKQKEAKNEALAKLTALVQHFDPTATRVHVLRKIESLRACLRREYKKVKESRLHATCPEDLYKPTLWYYDLMSFVCRDEDIGGERESKGEEIITDQNEDYEYDDIVLDEGNYEGSRGSTYKIEYNMDPSSIGIESSSNTSSLNKRFLDEELKNGKRRRTTEVLDEYDAIGVNVAAKLRNLPDNMRILAEKLINDVLFQAQTNKLNSSTVLSTTQENANEEDTKILMKAKNV